MKAESGGFAGSGVVWVLCVGVWALQGFPGGVDGLVEITGQMGYGLVMGIASIVAPIVGGLLCVQLFVLPPLTLFAVAMAVLRRSKE